MTRRIAILAAILGAAALIVASPRPVDAATATGNLVVTAHVVPYCTIAASQALDFPNYDTNSAVDLDAPVANIAVQCTRGSPFYISLDNGQNFNAGRRMTDGAGNFLGYQLFTEGTHTTPWANPSGTVTVNTAGAGLHPASIPVYGRIPAGQDVPVGTFTDTIVVTVTF
jgi:spore coat protein U-like protein